MPKKLNRPLKSGTVKADPKGRGNKFEKMGSPKRLKAASAMPVKGLMKKKRGK